MSFELLLFTTEPDRVEEAQAGGVDGVIVDWEQTGKHRRQRGADTEINRDTVDDLRRVREVARRVVCRINRPALGDYRELETAVAEGADEVLIPMVRTAGELERILVRVDGRCGVGALIETEEAVENAREIGSLPLARVYVGLNDLAIQRGSYSIFTAVVDGTLERVRSQVRAPFGFGGLTLPSLGAPVPCRLLLGEMARLDCDFTFLRRSYKRDVPLGAQTEALVQIRHALLEAGRRDGPSVFRDHQELVRLIPGEGVRALAGPG